MVCPSLSRSQLQHCFTQSCLLIAFTSVSLNTFFICQKRRPEACQWLYRLQQVSHIKSNTPPLISKPWMDYLVNLFFNPIFKAKLLSVLCRVSNCGANKLRCGLKFTLQLIHTSAFKHMSTGFEFFKQYRYVQSNHVIDGVQGR